MLSTILGIIVVVLLVDALLFKGELRKWTWNRIKGGK